MKNSVTIEEQGEGVTLLKDIKAEVGDVAVTEVDATNYWMFVHDDTWRCIGGNCTGQKAVSALDWPASLLPKGTVLRLVIGGEG